MIKAYKIQLKPNNKQQTKLFQNAGVARWAYNWALARQQENYKNGGKFISEFELQKQLTQLKLTDEFKWINNYSRQTVVQAIKDACQAYKRFFKGLSGFPKFKSKKSTKQSFYSRYDKIRFTETHVRLEKIGWIKLAERNRIPVNFKYSNPRVKFDGLNWWLTVGVEFEPAQDNTPYSEPIGIDLGVKDLAVVSTGEKFKNINKSKKVKKLEKKLKRLQRKVSRKYEKGKEGNRYRKTKNIIKLEHLIRKTYQRFKNIRTNYIHQITTKLVKTKPEYVVMEDLNVSGMIKNHKLAKAVQEQTLKEFRRQMEYKCEWNGIRLIIADRFYPSSKMCSECGYILKKLSLSTRKWVCPVCGTLHDRDLNASINLMKYPVTA